MPTPAERSALLFVASIAALGVGLRGCRALRPTPIPVESRVALARQIAAVDSAVAAGGRRRSEPRAKPVESPGQPSSAVRGAAPSVGGRPAVAAVGAPALVDVDRAGATALQSLPGIGPALAERIIANRDSAGAYGSLEGLQQVRGIGPALAAKLAPHVTFSGLPRPAQSGRSGGRRTHP